VLEGKILQLTIGCVKTQAMGNGCVNIKSLARDARPLAARHIAQRSHVVCTVGELYQNNPDIACHCQQHFPKRLGLIFFPGIELELFELGQAVDQVGHGRAKTLDQFGLGHAAILDCIVKQRGHQRLCVQLPLRALQGHCDWMSDVGFATVSKLPKMRLIGKPICLPYALNVRSPHVVEFCGKRSKARSGSVGSGGRRLAGCSRRKQCVHALNVSRPVYKY